LSFSFASSQLFLFSSVNKAALVSARPNAISFSNVFAAISAFFATICQSIFAVLPKEISAFSTSFVAFSH
jgi:hypothetical protein